MRQPRGKRLPASEEIRRPPGSRGPVRRIAEVSDHALAEVGIQPEHLFPGSPQGSGSGVPKGGFALPYQPLPSLEFVEARLVSFKG